MLTPTHNTKKNKWEIRNFEMSEKGWSRSC